MTSEFPWLEDLYRCVRDDEIDIAINIIMRNIDDMLCDHRYVKCARLLERIDVEQLDTNLLVALLSITYAAGDVLTTRAGMVQRVERRLTELAPSRVGSLMRGRR